MIILLNFASGPFWFEDLGPLYNVDIRCPPEDSLPRDSATIESTRARIREVYAKLMDTQEKRTVSLLRAAALWKRNWKELEKGTLRMLADAALHGVS